MRKSALLILTTFILSLTSISQALNPLELGNKIFSAFKGKDFQSYERLLTDSTDYKEFLSDYFKNDPIGKTHKKNTPKKPLRFPDSAEIQYRKEFNRLIKEGEELGIDWAKIEKPNFIYNKDEQVGTGLNSLNGSLKFIYNNINFMIFGIQATQYTSGYKIAIVITVMKDRNE